MTAVEVATRIEAPTTAHALRWHVERHGAGPAILALHGTGGAAASFAGLAARLADTYEVVAPDLPGHAGTPLPPGFEPTLPGIAGALGELCRALRIAPRVVIGHSAGAAILARMILDGAVRPGLLVGLGAALTPLRGPARALFPLSARWLDGPGAAVASAFAGRRGVARALLASTGSRLDDAGVERYRRLAGDPVHVRGVVAMLARWDLGPTWRAISDVGIPVRLLVGDRDRAAPPREQARAASRLADAEVRIVPGLGHLLHEEDPSLVAEILRSLVRDDTQDRSRSVDSA